MCLAFLTSFLEQPNHPAPSREDVPVCPPSPAGHTHISMRSSAVPAALPSCLLSEPVLRAAGSPSPRQRREEAEGGKRKVGMHSAWTGRGSLIPEPAALCCWIAVARVRTPTWETFRGFLGAVKSRPGRCHLSLLQKRAEKRLPETFADDFICILAAAESLFAPKDAVL